MAPSPPGSGVRERFRPTEEEEEEEEKDKKPDPLHQLILHFSRTALTEKRWGPPPPPPPKKGG